MSLLKLSDQSELSLEGLCQQADSTLLYFYPKDMTSGCTQQAEMLRDAHETFQSHGVQVIGVSRDSMSRHHKFIEKHALPFRLISDEDSLLCEQFGVLAEKSMYGRKYVGIVRSSFLLSSEGKIMHEWRNVKIKEHVEDLVQNLARYKADVA